MQIISFKLEVFEGPMDLLLSLISKHKLNIYDIEISSLLEQYLAYIEQCREQDLELAGDFLEMAARLIYIKTVSLLPRPEEAQKEKQALQGALIEYALCKQAAHILREQYMGGLIYVRKPMSIPVDPVYRRSHEAVVLVQTWKAMGLKKYKPQEQVKEKFQQVVSRPVVSVLSKIVYLMRKVYHAEHVYLGALYADVRERSARVALFLAVLELTKSRRIGISEDGTYLYRRTDVYKHGVKQQHDEEELVSIEEEMPHQIDGGYQYQETGYNNGRNNEKEACPENRSNFVCKR